VVDNPGAAIREGGLAVIGAGFGWTGTLSMKATLEEPGFDRCCHMAEVFGTSLAHPMTSLGGNGCQGKPVD